jgi:hypothetical protein
MNTDGQSPNDHRNKKSNQCISILVISAILLFGVEFLYLDFPDDYIPDLSR